MGDADSLGHRDRGCGEGVGGPRRAAWLRDQRDEVTLTGNLLNIVAEHKEEPKKKEKAEPVERHRNTVRRNVMLPECAKVEGITALYRNGILELHVPKAPEVLPRRVEVKT